MRILHCKKLIVCLGLLCAFAVPVSAKERRVENLNQLIDEAISNNPQIKAFFNNWKSEEFKITQVRHLPDPTARVGFFGESVETRVGPQEQKFGASLKIPFPPKLKHKGESQTKTAEISKEEFEAVKREIIKSLKFVYYDIFWVDKAIQITREEKAILGSLESVARRRYETNLTHQQDVVKAQVEISKLIDKLLILRENRKSLVSRINSILNRPRNTPFGSTGNVRPKIFTLNLSQLSEMAGDTRQELKGANLAIARAEHEKSLAKLAYVPDFTFGFDYTWVGKGHTMAPDDGKDAWIGTVSINVPIWFGKIKAKINEKSAALEARKRNYQDVKNSVAYEVEDLYYKIVSYRDVIDLYSSALIPQTEQSFEAARIAYEAGQVDFLNWLDSERTLLQTRLSYYKAVVDYQKSIAFLERAVGSDL